MKRAVLITGAGSGIGRQTALSFARAGYFVYLLGRNKEKLELVAAECRSGARRYGCDLADSTQIEKTIDDVLSHRDTQVTAVINNAGIFAAGPLEETSLATWRQQFETNLFGAAYLTQKLIPHLKTVKGASIVNVASTLGLRTRAGTGVYSASKAAMISWTQTLALELAANQIRVNCVCPGLVDTPIHQGRDMSTMNNLQPLGRVGQPEDISETILFLCSEASCWTTGVTVPVDGGINLA